MQYNNAINFDIADACELSLSYKAKKSRRGFAFILRPLYLVRPDSSPLLSYFLTATRAAKYYFPSILQIFSSSRSSPPLLYNNAINADGAIICGADAVRLLYAAGYRHVRTTSTCCIFGRFFLAAFRKTSVMIQVFVLAVIQKEIQLALVFQPILSRYLRHQVVSSTPRLWRISSLHNRL